MILPPVLLALAADPRAPDTSRVNRRQCITNLLLTSSTSLSILGNPATAYGSTNTAAIVNGDRDDSWEVTLPLEACPGGASCLRLTLLGKETYASTSALKIFPKPVIPYRVYRVIVDTGSPYLVVSENDLDGSVIASGYYPVNDEYEDTLDNVSSLGAIWSGLVQSIQGSLAAYLPNMAAGWDDVPFNFNPTSYGPTEEIYGSQLGSIQWMASTAKFRNARLVTAQLGQGDTPTSKESNPGSGLVLGVMDDALTRESGGSLIGLVKRSNLISNKIQQRPTFLEQERLQVPPSSTQQQEEEEEELDIASFRLDYPNKELFLSSKSLIPAYTENAFPLVDLRPLGDFVEHYASVVDEVVFNDITLNSQLLHDTKRSGGIRSKPRDIVAVFDSGLTGCLLIKPFWDRLIEEGLDPFNFSSVDVKIKNANFGNGKKKKPTHSSSIASSASTNKLFYVAPISLDWFDDEDAAPYVIILGQTFLAQGSLTVDIDGRRAIFAAG